jgi:putative transcriptional regulator
MSGSRIVESMKEAVAIAEGILPKGSYMVHIPNTVDVKAIRSGLGLSQASFSARFGLSLHTLRNWEQGKRKPDPAARAYLKVIEKAPDVVAEALSAELSF